MKSNFIIVVYRFFIFVRYEYVSPYGLNVDMFEFNFEVRYSPIIKQTAMLGLAFCSR